MIKAPLTLINKLGLHARAAAKLSTTASQYSSRINVDKAGRCADCKSIMAVMMLAASKGTELIFEVEGEDEEAAFAAIQALIEDRFGEPE